MRENRAATAPAVLRSQLLAELPWLAHGFSTRAAGDLAEPGAARERFVAAVTGSPGGWRWRGVKQMHSAVIRGDALPEAPGDGLVSRQTGELLTIRTADCVPILIADAEQRIVAALHAGWRGTLARIAEKGVGDLQAQFGSQPRHLRAAIGPSIRRCCYQVGPEVAEAFASQFDYADALFDQPAPDPVAERYPMLFLTGAPPGHPRDPRWNRNANICLDLAEANRRQLLAVGVPAGGIEVLPFCTGCRADWFFSYRRERASAGRMMAAIGIRP